MSDDSGNGSFTVVLCDTPGCSLGKCRVSLTFLYSGSLTAARRCRASISKNSKRCKKNHITVNLRPAATSTSCDSWLGFDLRKERRCRRNCENPLQWRERPSSCCACCDCLRNGRRLTRSLMRECRMACGEPPFADRRGG
jgi:hypothetical protein